MFRRKDTNLQGVEVKSHGCVQAPGCLLQREASMLKERRDNQAENVIRQNLSMAFKSFTSTLCFPRKIFIFLQH